MRARILTLAIACLLFGGTAATGIAGGGFGGDHDQAGKGQYRPGCGNGDKNHHHTGPPGRPDKDCDDGHGHGDGAHHHHKQWRDGGRNGHQWCDDGRNWHDWNGSDGDW
jgi:hypothetical protein